MRTTAPGSASASRTARHRTATLGSARRNAWKPIRVPPLPWAPRLERPPRTFPRATSPARALSPLKRRRAPAHDPRQSPTQRHEEPIFITCSGRCLVVKKSFRLRSSRWRSHPWWVPNARTPGTWASHRTPVRSRVPSSVMRFVMRDTCTDTLPTGVRGTMECPLVPAPLPGPGRAAAGCASSGVAARQRLNKWKAYRSDRQAHAT